MKKKFLVGLGLMFIISGCSVNDFSPDVVIPKAINSIDKTKNKIYLSSNKGFLEKTLKKQDITEEEYQKLKEILRSAKIVNDYSIISKIMNFEPFKKRLKLENAVNKLLSINYNKVNLFVYKRVNERGFLVDKEVPNNDVLQEIDVDLIQKYNEYLNLAKKYKMFSLIKKLEKNYPKIKQNYDIGLMKIFNYLMIFEAYKEQSPEFILKVSKRLFEDNKTEEAETLLMSFVKFKLNKDLSFNIKPFYDLLVKYSYVKDANQLRKIKADKIFKYAKNNLSKNSNFDITNYCKILNELGFNNYSSNLERLKLTLKEKQQLLSEFANAKRKLLKGKIVKINNLVKKLKKYDLNKEARQLSILYNAALLKKTKRFLLQDKKSKIDNLRKTSLYVKVHVKTNKNFICDISGYKAIETVDNFGNKNIEYIPKLKATILKWIKKKDYTNLEKFFAENIYFNMNGYNGFNKLLNDKIERAVFYNGTLRGFLSGAISSGQLPSSIEINTLNIATIKNKVHINTNIYNIAGAFTSYFLSSRSINTMRDRLLLMISFLLQKNSILIPFECKNNVYSDFAENLLSDYMLTGFIELLQKKDIDALHLAFLLLQHKYSDVDKFLLNKKEVKRLFLVGKKYYFQVAKIYKPCKKVDKLSVGYICFPSKEEAVMNFNKLEKSPKNIKLVGKTYVTTDDGTVGTFLSNRYCRLRKGDILPKVFYMKYARKNKYCIFIYEGVRKEY